MGSGSLKARRQRAEGRQALRGEAGAGQLVFVERGTAALLEKGGWKGLVDTWGVA